MDPARMFKESLTPRPELENSQGHSRPFGQTRALPLFPRLADIFRVARHVSKVPATTHALSN